MYLHALVLLLASAALAWAPLADALAQNMPENAHRRLLQAPQVAPQPAPSGNRYIAPGGRGSWEMGGSTGAITIHASLMNDGTVVGWGSTDLDQSQGLFPSTIYNPLTKSFEQLLGSCGIHDCKNAFCSGQVTTFDSEVLIFGGHGKDPEDLQWFRRYSHSERSVSKQQMSSARWYPTPTTLPDGRVIVIGGVPDAGDAGYDGITRALDADPALDNPTYEIYDPVTDSFSGDRWDMEDQLHAAHPINTYPHVIVTPDGGLAVSSGSLLVRYNQTGSNKYEKVFEYEDRPGAPWSYPQTGSGLPLPMSPPYDKMMFLAVGGVSEDYATQETPASDEAHLIELSGGAGTAWQSVGPLPQPRVMGDCVILCDGTIGVFNGAGKGIGGWNENEDQEFEFKDGTSWWCEERCSSASKPVYEPTIYDPATGKWTEAGSLAEASRMRLYHSVAMLLPDCRVMTSGSDVTDDKTAEIFSPPYLSLGPRPVISSAPITLKPGDELTVTYNSTDPVTRAILVRAAAVTHSLPFDTRALWLFISSNGGGVMTLRTPVSYNKLPPGMYMLAVLSSKGVPSEAKIVSVPPAPRDDSE